MDGHFLVRIMILMLNIKFYCGFGFKWDSGSSCLRAKEYVRLFVTGFVILSIFNNNNTSNHIQKLDVIVH